MSLPSNQASPVGAREEGILQNYFLLLSQFAFDKAKEIFEKEKEIHKAAFGSSWALMVHSLGQFAVAEKTYMSLGFLEQKWFGRSKDSLRNSYQVLMLEFRKIEEGVKIQEHSSGPAVEFEMLLSHLCGQLCEYIRARQKTMDFYEQMSTLGTNKNLSYEDLTEVVSEIIHSHSRNFHHPILSNLKSGFTCECDIINHLLNGQILMTSGQFLPALLQLYQGHSKVTSWGSASQAIETTKKSMFGSSTKTVSCWPALYQWLQRYKCLLVAKFSLYFYDILSKQTISSEMKALSAKNTEDFVSRLPVLLARKASALKAYVKRTTFRGLLRVQQLQTATRGLTNKFIECLRHKKIMAFHKKSDALNVSIVLDTQGIEHLYRGHGYQYPDRHTEERTGLEMYPAIFSHPGEYPSQHWPNVVSLIASDRYVDKDKVQFVYDKGIQTTYFIVSADPRIYVVIIYETKKSEKDSYINNFLLDISSQLRCIKLFSNLKPGSKVGGSRK